MTKNGTTLALIQKDINYIQKDVADIKEALEKNYVTKEEYEPVKKIVYGLVSLILVAVVGALITLIIK